MKLETTKVTSKGQTTIPLGIRKILNANAGKEVEWHVVKSMVVIDRSKKTSDPVKFLTSQIKLNLDAVKLVRAVREES